MRLPAAAMTATALMLAVLPTAAFARPGLVTSTPAANSTVARPTAITLNFTETIEAQLSGIDLVMTGMPGMADHKPMPIKGMPTQVKGRTIAAALPRPLPSGTYTLTWHAVGADRQRNEGSYGFTVK